MSSQPESFEGYFFGTPSASDSMPPPSYSPVTPGSQDRGLSRTNICPHHTSWSSGLSNGIRSYWLSYASSHANLTFAPFLLFPESERAASRTAVLDSTLDAYNDPIYEETHCTAASA